MQTDFDLFAVESLGIKFQKYSIPSSSFEGGNDIFCIIKNILFETLYVGEFLMFKFLKGFFILSRYLITL